MQLTFDYSAQRVARALYPDAYAWHQEHPEAAEYIITRALQEQAAGRSARISKLMEECLETPSAYGLTAKGRTYGSNRNEWPILARYFEALTGAPFTKRRSKSDAGAVNASVA